jgi:hypothetical protein
MVLLLIAVLTVSLVRDVVTSATSSRAACYEGLLACGIDGKPQWCEDSSHAAAPRIAGCPARPA